MSTPLRPPVSAGNNSAESKEKKVSLWETEMIKFVGELVEVEYAIGDRCVKISGRLRAFAGMGLHVVVDADKTAIFIRIPLSITRLRKGAKVENAA